MCLTGWPNRAPSARKGKIMLQRAIVIALILSLFAQPPLAFAQKRAVSDNWDAVTAVAAGEKLVVKLKDGKTIKGEIQTATDQELTMTRKNKSVTAARAQIAQVYQVVGKPAKGKYTLIGAGIGAAVGAGIGQAKVEADAEIWLPIGFMFGVGIGALVGLGWGASKRREVLIYQAR
jgi:small nuclear ribonucleoprotein (snRNP)-like protein